MILCIRSPLKTVSILSDVYDRELVATIGWAKQVHRDQSMVMMISLKGDCDDHCYDHCTVFQVPGFTDLTLNDQMKLLQNTWTEVLTLSLLFRSLPKTGKLNFAADLSLNETEASQCGLELFYEKVNKVDITESSSSLCSVHDTAGPP